MLKNDALISLRPSLLADAPSESGTGWIMPYKADFDPDDLDHMLICAEIALEPSPDDVLAQAIDQVWETLSLKPLSPLAAQGYLEALSSIPSDLIWEAANGVMRTYVYPTPPKPAHFHEQIMEEMIDRRVIRHRIEIMKNQKAYLKRLKEQNQ